MYYRFFTVEEIISSTSFDLGVPEHLNAQDYVM
jgi:hypothetical protein